MKYIKIDKNYAELIMTALLNFKSKCKNYLKLEGSSANHNKESEKNRLDKIISEIKILEDVINLQIRSNKNGR